MKPNDHLTNRIPILVSAQKGKVVFANPSDEVPFIRGVQEFTAAHMTPGTRQHKQMERGTSDRDRLTLKALRLLQYVYSSRSHRAARELDDALAVLAGGGWDVKKVGLSTVPKKEVAAQW